MNIIQACITYLLVSLAQCSGYTGGTWLDYTLQLSSGLLTCTGLGMEMARVYNRTELLLIGKEVLSRKKSLEVSPPVYKILRDNDICAVQPFRLPGQHHE